MKVLVAGATGAVGLRAVQALVARGHEVTGISRTADGRRLLEDLGAEAVVADAMDAASVARAVADAGPEAVVDVLTAVPRGGAWRAEDMAPTNQLRIHGTRHLLDAAQKAGVRRYVAESSYLIYGSGDLGDEPLTEDRAPVHPRPWLLREAVDALATRSRRWSAVSVEGSCLCSGRHLAQHRGCTSTRPRTPSWLRWREASLEPSTTSSRTSRSPSPSSSAASRPP